eukprot:UN10626
MPTISPTLYPQYSAGISPTLSPNSMIVEVNPTTLLTSAQNTLRTMQMSNKSIGQMKNNYKVTFEIFLLMIPVAIFICIIIGIIVKKRKTKITCSEMRMPRMTIKRIFLVHHRLNTDIAEISNRNIVLVLFNLLHVIY